MSKKGRLLSLLICCFGLLVVWSTARADVYSISFNFDSQTGVLGFKSDNVGAVSIDPTKFLPMDTGYELYPDGTYEAVFVSVKGNEIDRKRFKVIPGNFSVDFPYYSIAKTLNIYKVDSSDILLSLDLSKFTTCFMNGVCEYERGENLRTCISDCASDTVQFSDETKKLLAQNNDLLKDPKTGEILLRGPKAVAAVTNTPVSAQSGGGNTVVLVILVAFLVVIGIFIVVILKIRKRNRRYGL